MKVNSQLILEVEDSIFDEKVNSILEMAKEDTANYPTFVDLAIKSVQRGNTASLWVKAAEVYCGMSYNNEPDLLRITDKFILHVALALADYFCEHLTAEDLKETMQ